MDRQTQTGFRRRRALEPQRSKAGRGGAVGALGAGKEAPQKAGRRGWEGPWSSAASSGEKSKWGAAGRTRPKSSGWLQSRGSLKPRELGAKSANPIWMDGKDWERITRFWQPWGCNRMGGGYPVPGAHPGASQALPGCPGDLGVHSAGSKLGSRHPSLPRDSPHGSRGATKMLGRTRAAPAFLETPPATRELKGKLLGYLPGHTPTSQHPQSRVGPGCEAEGSRKTQTGNP